MRVCVVGLGKIGLPLAVRLAESGATVAGLDVDPRTVEAVNSGDLAHAGEPGLVERAAALRTTGRLHATLDPAEALRGAQAIVVLVRLVIDGEGHPDYRNLDAATEAIGRHVEPGALVCYETTVPVGDTRTRFAPTLERLSGLAVGESLYVCFSPERVSSGSVFRGLDAYAKLVGGVTPACADAGVAFYGAHLSAEVRRLSSAEAAELTKIAEALYRDVNIALANEIARFADERAIDVTEVIGAANSQPYSHIHQPGLGVGGHCIPVYPNFFIRAATDARLTATARRLSTEMPTYGAARLGSLLGGLDGRRVLVLGLAFRGDVREAGFSMTLPLVSALRAQGAEVRVHDPLFGRTGVDEHGYIWGDLEDGWAEALVLQAAHSAYRELTPERVPGVIAVLDGRNVMDPAPWRAAGVAFAGIGR
jgi:nucleotide sugar dehydrogenase